MEKRIRMYEALFRRWYLVLTGGYLIFLYYVTLVPFHFSRDPGYILRKFHKFELVPYFLKFHQYSGADIVLNILLFLPVGLLLVYDLSRLTQWSVKARLILAVLMGTLISTSIEIFQVFTYDRSPTVSDIINNSLGTFLGGLILAFFLQKQPISFQKWRKGIIELPECLITGGLVLLIIFIYLAPFDFKVNVRSVSSRLVQFIHNPLQLKGFWVSELMVIFLVFLSLYYFWFAALMVRPAVRGERMLKFLAFLLPVGFEVLQLGVPERRLSILDVLVAWSALALVRHYFQSHQLSMQLHKRFSQHAAFLKKLAVGYGVFLVFHLFVLPALAFKSSAVVFNWKFFVDPLVWILRKDRLLSVVWFMQWMIIFVPFGFFIQGFFTTFSRRIGLLTLVVAGGSVPLLLGVPAFQVHWTQLLGALLGSSIGRELWYFYSYLFSKENSRILDPQENTAVIKS